MTESFTLKKDTNNIPVCAYQVGANALNYLAWVAVQVVDDTQTTDAAGVFTAANKPILDSNGDGDITAADVLPRRTDTGVTLYVGTDEGEVNSNAGEITLYTDEALTVPAASLEVKCTYWTLVPLAVDSSGRLVLAPTSTLEISGSALPDGAATEATLATLATEATLQTIATQVTLAAVEAILTAIKDTAGIKKIVDALPAGTNKLGLMGVTNSDGSRHAHVHNSLGDEEDFTESLSSSAFLLTYDAAAGKWKRFRIADITSKLDAIKDTDGIKKITDALPAGTNIIGKVSLLGNNVQVGAEVALAWANDDPADTLQVTADIDLPATLQQDAMYLVSIENPSEETALTVNIYSKGAFNANTRYARLATFSVPASPDNDNPDQVSKVAVTSKLVQGMLLNQGARITAKNDTVIGAAGAFTARITIFKV